MSCVHCFNLGTAQPYRLDLSKLRLRRFDKKESLHFGTEREEFGVDYSMASLVLLLALLLFHEEAPGRCPLCGNFNLEENSIIYENPYAFGGRIHPTGTSAALMASAQVGCRFCLFLCNALSVTFPGEWEQWTWWELDLEMLRGHIGTDMDTRAEIWGPQSSERQAVLAQKCQKPLPGVFSRFLPSVRRETIQSSPSTRGVRTKPQQ